MKASAMLTAVAMMSVAASAAQAQATRTWVSGVGDDANPCSRTAPCKTFAGAISKTAVGGEINALDPGGFGGVTITKSITLDGGPGIAGVLVAGTNGITVAAGPTDFVMLRNLDIDGAAHTGLSGISAAAFGRLSIENVTIYGFQNYGIDIHTNQTQPAYVSIRDSYIANNVNAVQTSPAAGAIYVRPVQSTAVVAITGVTGTHSGFGLRVEGGGQANVFNSSFDDNLGNGVVAAPTSGSALINIKNTLVANNASRGVYANGANAVVTLSSVGIFGNATGIAAAGGGSVVSFGNNENSGNVIAGAPTSTQPLQ